MTEQATQNPFTWTSPSMDDFNDWHPIAFAPRDGSEFMGGHEGTGNVFTTWYEPRWGSDAAVAEGDIAKAVIWWCRQPDGKVTSFFPTHFRAKL